MRQARGAQRLGYFAATVALIAAIVACGSGDSYTYVPTAASEGRVEGLVLNPDATPAAGLVVTATPASVTSPASASTSAAGRYELRAPAGQVTLTISGAGIQPATVSVTVVSNQLTTAPDVTIAPLP